MLGQSVLSSSIKQIGELLRNGSISSSELCELSLRRIKNTESLNAFITVTSDKCRKLAEAADKRFKAGKPLGPLDGIPFAAKDNYNTKNDLTSCGSKILKNYISPYDSTVVEKLQNAGMVIIGKANLDEFGMGSGGLNSCFGPTKNIWKSNIAYELKQEKLTDSSSPFYVPSHLKANEAAHNQASGIKDDNSFSPGGSSSGSAVVVASGSCFAALGSDTGGSVRMPASWCGLVGFKPTYGSISRHGLIPLINSMDTAAFFTRCVDDTATILEVLSGEDEKDSTTIKNSNISIKLPDNPQVSGLTVGIPQEYYIEEMNEELKNAWISVADMLEEAGAKVIPVSLPHSRYSLLCYRVLCCCEVASNMARYDGLKFGLRANEDRSAEQLYAATRHAGFNDTVRGRLLTGNYFLLRKHYDEYFNQTLKVRRLVKADFDKVFKEQKVDVLLAPTTPELPQKLNEFAKSDTHQILADYFTQPMNLAGIIFLLVVFKIMLLIRGLIVKYSTFTK